MVYVLHDELLPNPILYLIWRLFILRILSFS